MNVADIEHTLTLKGYLSSESFMQSRICVILQSFCTSAVPLMFVKTTLFLFKSISYRDSHLYTASQNRNAHLNNILSMNLKGVKTCKVQHIKYWDEMFDFKLFSQPPY